MSSDWVKSVQATVRGEKEVLNKLLLVLAGQEGYKLAKQGTPEESVADDMLLARGHPPFLPDSSKKWYPAATSA